MNYTSRQITFVVLGLSLVMLGVMVYWGSSHYSQTKGVNQRAVWVTLSIRRHVLTET